MKKFKTMSELDILNAANETILGYWVREVNLLEENPDNEIAKFKMQLYCEKLEELESEICRLEREAKKSERECYEA